MNRKPESEGEYIQLLLAYNKAKHDGDEISIQRIKPLLDERDALRWQSKTNVFPELAPYKTIVEALEDLCRKNSLPFPDLNDRERNFTGRGDWREDLRFMFGVGGLKRSVEIWPMEDFGYINIKLFEGSACFIGKTTSLEESAIVLSRWYVEECSIQELHKQFPWISDKPFKLSGPRVTYE